MTGAGPAVRHLPPIDPPEGEAPGVARQGASGAEHPMRAVTEAVAADPSWWTPEQAARVAGFFDDMADGWDTRAGGDLGPGAVVDALTRGGPFRGPVVELGAGTGAGTRVLTERLGPVLALDLSAGMLAHLHVPGALPVLGDASRLPVADGSVGTLVCLNMLLFADEVRRVLRGDGALVWVNSRGEHTPIHLSAEAVATALGDGFEVTASRIGWSTWAVARRVGLSGPAPRGTGPT
ncbi:MAG: class I SAM-dependent methyltransferase [Microthrixaceae bacterium]